MSLTFGSSSAPSNITTYLDSLFAQSLANYRPGMVDNIGAANALLFKLLKGDSYESADGGTYIAENLMYGLAPSDWYDGYDELGTIPTDGVGQAQFEWRQTAAQIVYSMKEVIQNKHKLSDLVKTRIQQSEMGLQESFAQALWWGNVPNGGSLIAPLSSLVTGASALEPITRLIQYDPTVSDSPGNINQSTSTFWRNRKKQSAATTFDGFMLELNSFYNTCALGTGGPPDLIIMDQVSYELFCQAYWIHYRSMPGESLDFPFENKKFKQAIVVMDDKVPDVHSGTIPTLVSGSGDPTTLTYGSAFFINSKFFRLRYLPERDFEMLKDENGKTFVKPLNGDSRIGHVAWMGNLTCNNRRKHGVMGHIARTMTVS